jgi:hypothetical protein
MPKNVQGPDQGRVKFRVIEFEVEGANPTLIESIKNLGAAISRGNGSQTMKAVRSAANGAGAAALGAGVDAADDAEDDTDVESIDHEPATPRKAAGPRKKPTLKPVPGIDWNGPTPSLKDFVDGLDLGDAAIRKYAAIAHWFKEYRDTPSITVHYIYSAYKALGWTDLPQYPVDTLQDLKNQRRYKWMDAGEKRGEYVFNAYGDQEVAKWARKA